MNPYFAAHLELPSSRQAILSTNSPSSFSVHLILTIKQTCSCWDNNRRIDCFQFHLCPVRLLENLLGTNLIYSYSRAWLMAFHGFMRLFWSKLPIKLKADNQELFVKSSLNIFARRICMPRGETLFNLSRSLYDICSVIGSVTKTFHMKMAVPRCYLLGTLHNTSNRSRNQEKRYRMISRNFR